MRRQPIQERPDQDRGTSNDGYRAKLYRESSRLAHEGIRSVTSAPAAVPALLAFAPGSEQRVSAELKE